MANEIYDPLIGEHSKAAQETYIRENEEKDKQIAALISANKELAFQVLKEWQNRDESKIAQYE